MFPYRVQYNESESDIQNNNLLYKNTSNDKILSKSWKVNRLFTPPKTKKKTDTHRRVWTRIGCIIPVRIFIQNIFLFKIYILKKYIYYMYICIHFIYFYIYIYIYIVTFIYIYIYMYWNYIYIYVYIYIFNYLIK